MQKRLEARSLALIDVESETLDSFFVAMSNWTEKTQVREVKIDANCCAHFGISKCVRLRTAGSAGVCEFARLRFGISVSELPRKFFTLLASWQPGVVSSKPA